MRTRSAISICKMSKPAKCQGGFTLFEVLVAVGVIAMVMPALLLVLRERANSVAYLRDQTLAQWVAANRLAELRLGGLGDDETSGVSEMGGRRWSWSLELKDTGVDGFSRVDIAVGAEDVEGDLSVLTGFVRSQNPSIVPVDQ